MANDQALDTLQIDIQASGVSAAEGIQKLADAITNLRDAVGKNTSWTDRFAKSISAINTAVGRTNYGKIMSVSASLSQLANSLNMVHGASAQSFQNVVKRIEKLEGTVTKSAESVEKMKESLNGGWSGTGQSNPITETLDGITESAKEAQKEVSKVADQIKGGTFNMPGLGGASRVSNTRKALESQRARVYSDATNAAQQQAAQIVATASRVFATIKKAAGASIRATIRLVENIGRAFMKVGKIAGSVFLTPLKAVGNRLRTLYRQVTGFIRAIGRIALYRAIRSAIKAVTQGLQEGIQNLYQWSLLMDHTFANSMDSIATSMQYLHNGFAAMFSPLIEYAAPILEEITNKVVDFFNIIQQIFATLTGQSTWLKAIRVQQQYGQQITETGQAAEKAMHQLMAFDELNVITTPSAGGSGGGGSSTPDYGSMFTTEEVDTELTSWVQDIMDFFESGQWTRLGSYIGEKLNNIVNQWNAFADGFNFGLKIRHALQALNSFLETFNFYDLGSKVGDWLAGFVNGVDPAEVQKSIVHILNSAVSGASGLIDAINRHNIPAKIGQALGAAFANFNWEGLANLARKILTGVVAIVNSAAQSFIANGGPQKLIDAAKEIGSAIGEAFATADWGSITTIITSIFTGLVSMFSTAISSFVEMGGPAKLKESLATIGTAIGTAFGSIRGKDLAEIINAISTGIFEMFKNGISAFSKGQGWKQLGEFVKNLDWKTLLTLTGLVATLKFGVPIIEGLTKAIIEQAIISHLLSSVTGAAAGAAAGAAGTAEAASGAALAFECLAAGAGFALTLTIGTLFVLKLAGVEMPWDQWVEQIKEDVSTFMDEHNPFKLITELITGYEYELGDDGMYHPVVHDTSDSHSGTSGRGGWHTFNYLSSALGDVSVLDGLRDELTSSDVPSLATTLGTELAKSLTEAIKSAKIPEFFKTEAKNALKQFLSGDYEGTGLKSASDIKTGFGRGNISEKFREEATVAASAFGSLDFSVEGLGAGDELKTGLDNANITAKFTDIRDNSINTLKAGDYAGAGLNIGNVMVNGVNQANLPGQMWNVGQQMISSLKNAGWEQAGAQMGAAAGSNFKAHFASYVKTTLQLQNAAGQPITQSYIVPYAKGGFPSQGSLFWAGEVAGQAELMGTINGRTGVASGREITGISDAVYSTGAEEATLLRQTNLLLQALLVKDPFGTPNSNAGRWIAQSQQAYKAVTG